MKLRNVILLILFLFGLAPLLIALAVNAPLLMDRLELFYNNSHLQNLRADFRDLDQHLASRHDSVRLLAKMPEAPLLIGSGMPQEAAKLHFLQWVNRMMQDQLDILGITFIGTENNVRYHMVRNPQNQKMEPDIEGGNELPDELFDTAMVAPPGAVLLTPVSINPEAEDPSRLMVLRLVSPVMSLFVPPGQKREGRMGVVAIDIDVGGLARAYRDTLWVHHDGRYLETTSAALENRDAFTDFPGLKAIFTNGELALWEGPKGSVIWIPLLLTENNGRLWAGREVDPSPLIEFRQTVAFSVLSIVIGLVLVVLIAARWFAVRVDRFSHELTDGIGKVLRNNEEVAFEWRGTQEAHDLGRQLTALAKTHADHTHKLEQHARELEESNRYKSQFLANVSHELRTPLNSILLLSKLLAAADSKLSPEQRKQAEVIHSAGADLHTLIDNILDLSRIEAGKCTFTLEKVDLPRTLDKLADMMRPLAENKGLKLIVDITADAPRTIVTDGEKLQQILKNFLSNAIKFTAQGEVAVCLYRNESRQGLSCPVRIDVRDTGVGIPVDKQAAVFEAFQQADGSTNRRYGGTGLGLTISRSLAEILGGRILLKSKPGQGSTFSVVLPMEFDRSQVPPDQLADADEDPDTHAPVEAPLVHAVPAADYAGARVLLVDDDLRNLLAMTPILESWHLHVTAAGDGREALDTLDEEPRFDLLLLDIMMPGMDGYDTLGELRARPEYRDLRVVILTARAGEDDEAQCLAAGADGYLRKPVDPAELKQELDRLLGAAQT
ncbi:MAG: response regulator [Chromatiales bacterium]|nr:response regulator [Gammaproteobacteria bacterium]MCP5351774.1 response regulator [Chromatiales bacterium]